MQSEWWSLIIGGSLVWIIAGIFCAVYVGRVAHQRNMQKATKEEQE